LLERVVWELPTYATGYRFLAASCAYLGDWDGARRALARLGPIHPSSIHRPTAYPSEL
jgi:hypothetical protein